MNVKRMLHTHLGQFFISVLLGLGLATLFRKVCSEKNCIDFRGPILSDFDGKIYKHNDKCYTYSVEPAKCDNMKKIVNIASASITAQP
jgi:hypothetical protein